MIRRALSIVAALLAMPLAAHAADDDASRREATRLMKEGKDLFAHSQFEEARVRYVAACALAHTPHCIGNLALTELHAGKLLDSYRHYKELLADPRTVDAYDRSELQFIQEREAEAYAQTGHVDVEAPPGARVRLDGLDVGTAPLREPLDVTAGDHQLQGELASRQEQVAVRALAGSLTHVRILVTAPAPASSAPLVMSPSPGPVSQPPPPRIEPPQPPEPDTRSTSPLQMRTVARWSLTGLAVAGVAVGLGFRFAVQSKADDVNAFRSVHPAACASMSSAACSQLQGLLDDHDRDVTVSRVAFVVGGVAALGAVATWLFWPEGSGKAGARLVPAAQAQGGRLDLVGRF